MQTKRMSLAETITSTAIGLVVSFFSNEFIFWYLHIPMSLGRNIGMTAFFTVISIARGYFVRRLFNKMHLLEAAKKDKLELGIGAPTYGDIKFAAGQEDDECCKKGTCG